MDPIEVGAAESGRFRLWLEAGTTDVDDVVSELGHTPNGYFWEGIVELLVTSEAPALPGRFEGGGLCAYSNDRAVLDDLAALLTSIATDEQRLRRLVELAASIGFVFDD